jgi:hypothetical protein
MNVEVEREMNHRRKTGVDEKKKRCDPQLEQQRSPEALLTFFLINFFCLAHPANQVTFNTLTAFHDLPPFTDGFTACFSPDFCR